MKNTSLQLNKTWLSFEQLKHVIDAEVKIDITSDTRDSINKCRAYLDKKITGTNDLFYGINTGFGFLQNVKIDDTQIEQLQYNLLKSHACGLGDEVPAPIVKLMLLLKIKSLSYGHSGVQEATVQRLIDMYNHNVLPIIYTQGSLGASGDLSPLSHLSLPLIGLGEVYFDSNKFKTAAILERFNWKPIS